MSDPRSTLPTVDAADGTDGATAPAITMQIGGKDPNGALQSIATDISGNVFVNQKISSTAASPTAVSVSTSSIQIVAANTARKGLVITNVSNNRISIAIGVTAVLNQGITLYPGGIYVMDAFTYNLSAFNAVASAASSAVAIQEFS